MIIIGHPLIPSMAFSRISNQEEIDHILADSIVWWESSQDPKLLLAHFCHTNQVQYAVKINSIKELLFYASLGAKYLIAPKDQIQIFQNIIKDYLLDTLLLCLIEDEEEIEELAQLGIDGAIFLAHL